MNCEQSTQHEWIAYMELLSVRIQMNSSSIPIACEKNRKKNMSNNGTALSINLNFVAANIFNGISVIEESVGFYLSLQQLNCGTELKNPFWCNVDSVKLT